MLSTLVHVALVAATLGACGLWWRYASNDAAVRAIVGAGILLRLIPGAALFWISYARWPIASGLQLGPGFWFFALDAETYYRLAATAASKGWIAIATISPLTPSAFYVKLLGAAIYVFGRTPATSLILNLIAYVALVAAIQSWHRRLGVGRWPLLLSLAIVSLMPSWILWSFQPLKDSAFLAFVGLLFCALDAWYARLQDARWGWPGAAVLLAAQALLVYAAAGIRWYFPLLICAMAPLALGAMLLARRRPSAWRLAAGAVAVVALVEVVPLAAGPYLPAWIRGILHPAPDAIVARLTRAPTMASAYLDRSYKANVGVAGATEVHVLHDEPDGGALLPDVVRSKPGSPATPIALDPWPSRLRGMLAVLLLPRILAQPLGHVSIGGGRGLWLFVDLDAVCFEVAAVLAIVTIARQRAAGGAFRPVFWQLLAVTIVITILLAAEGSNFGTLFRMRSMIALGVALLPLGMGRRAAS